MVEHLAANNLQSLVGLRVFDQDPLTVELRPDVFYCHFVLHRSNNISEELTASNPSFQLPFFHDAGGVTGDDGPGLNVAHNDGAGADDRPFAHSYARSYEGIGANPGLVTDGDRRFEQGEAGLAIIVGAGAEMGAMRDGGP